uniref:EF-hand domain-containing protein n=1 Tax=Spongospora subterranea TaxID=70186 RepID=A0A0H5R472_9EUKA|eukprot:CRZ08938.1 hypothetical protein [Spongospora subterranea]
MASEGETAQEVYNMFATAGYLKADDLGIALRSVGKRLTADQIKTLTAEANNKHKGKITFPIFQEFLAQSTKIQKTIEEISDAFKVFECKDKPGHINIEEFTHALTTLGDKLSRDEIATVIDDARRTGGDQNQSTQAKTIEYSKLLDLIKSIG